MTTITLGEVLNRLRDQIMADLRVAIPARVERFDAARQLVDVKPLLKETSLDEAGAEVVESLHVISNVPVQFPGTAAFALTFDVKPGDECLLVFSDRSLDKWISSGGEVDPVDLRRHHLSDAVALLGVRHAGAFAPVDADCAALRHRSGMGVYVKDGTVNLGSPAPGDALALASLVKAEIKALRDAYAGHGHNLTTAGTAVAQAGVTGTPCTGALAVPPVPPVALTPQVVPAVGSVASSKVKSD